MKTILNTLPESTFKSIGTTKKDFEENMKKNQIFGIDAEPRAVKVAKMNMMLWGDGKQVVIAGIMEHIEQAGVHSGDSACSLPPYTLSNEIQDRLRELMKKLGLALNVLV